MCLSVPGKLIAKDGLLGKVDVAGNTVNADLTFLPDAVPGDYLLVHAGFAIQKYDEQEALETLAIFRELYEATHDGTA